MDTAVGVDDVVVQFDDKHIIKRFREVLKSYSRGSMICRVKITGGLLKRFLDKLNLPNVEQLLHPDDAQNVLLAVSLLKVVAQLSTLNCSLTPLEEVILAEVKVLSFVCECLSYLFTVTLSLKDQLKKLSYLTERLDGLFSVLHTLTHNSNFDMLQCGERLSHATQISQLYQKHPEWKRASKGL